MPDNRGLIGFAGGGCRLWFTKYLHFYFHDHWFGYLNLEPGILFNAFKKIIS